MAWRPGRRGWANLQALLILVGALMGYLLGSASDDPGNRWVGLFKGGLVAAGLWYFPSVARRNFPHRRR